MSKVNRRTLQSLHKAFAVLTAVTTVLSLAGVLLVPDGANAAARPADYGLREGNTISAAGSDDPDVYIVNELGYKRLFLNPVIFSFYGHLGGFASVKTVSAATRDAFPTSGLFRNCEINDQKVYGFVSTGEDTGYLKWVNTSGAQAVADDPSFFMKVFCINNNEFAWYSKSSDYFTSVNQVPSYVRTPGSPSPVAGNVSVSLSAANPAASTTTLNAQGVEYLRVQLNGTGTVNSVTVKRTGPGSVDDFDNVYIYEGARRLVTGKSLTSSTGEATYSNLNLAVNGSKTLSVVADLSATAGNVNAFQLTGLTLVAGTVSGLPVAGNNMSVSGASSGTITQAKVGSLGNPNAGQQDVQLSEFKLSANTEAASVRRVQMLQGGTVSTSGITDLKLMTGSSTWTGTIDSAGYIVFDLSSGYSIVKGGNAIFKVYGDIAGKKDETIALYFEYATDILAVGDQYGYGMAVTLDANMDDSTNTHVLTLQGGVLTLTSSGLASSDIGTDTDDTTFLRYSMTAASNIEIRKHRLVISIDEAGDGTFDDFVVAASTSVADLDDIKVVNENTGAVLIGPVDGSSFDEVGTALNSAGGAVEGAMNTFSDVIELSAGQTLALKITADVQTSNTRAGSTLAASSKVAIGVQDYSDNTGVTELKYAGTNTSLAAADIVPNANIHGPTMTLTASGLTLSLASNPADQTVVQGSQDVDVVGIIFAASNASALKVTNITVTGYSDAAGDGAFDKGSAGDIGSIVSSVALVEKESGAVLSSTPSANNLAAAAGTVVFNNLNWNIPAGSSRTLIVRADLLNLTPPTKDEFSFDIAATTDVTALDNSNTTINAGNALPNSGTIAEIDTEVEVTSAGNIFVTEYESSPSKDKLAVYWGQTGVAVSQFNVRAAKEGFYIDTFNLVSADSADAKNNVAGVLLEYKDKNGNTLTAGPLSLNAEASVSFGFSGDNRPYIPKDSSRQITVKINTVGTHQNGATSAVDFAMNFSGGASDEFKATGEGSFAQVLGNDTTGDDTNSVTVTNKVLVYRSFPKFTNIVLPDGAATSNAVVGKFTITAMGYDVLFGTTAAASGTITFDSVASGQLAPADPTFTLYDDSNGQILDTATYDIDTLNASLSFATMTNALNIPAGQSKTLRVEGDLSGFNTATNTTTGLAADYFQLVLRDQTGVILWVDGAGADANLDQSNTAGYIDNLPFNGPNMTGQ